jgi:ketosteroid isomerase-like protein
MDFNRYIEVFNSGDDDALVDGWFTDDIVYVGGNRIIEGKEAWRGFLKCAHDGVREILRLQTLLQKDNEMFCEIDMDFHSTKARPDYPFKPMYPGDMMTVKFFVLYKLREGKICRLKGATWPVDYGISRLPRLGGSHVSQEAALQSFNAAYRVRDYERFGKFYTDDVVLKMGEAPAINSRDAVLNYYRMLFDKVEEDAQETSIDAADDLISIESNTLFRAKEDAPDFPFGALEKNVSCERKLLTVFDLQDGLIAGIRVEPATR